MTEKPRIRVAAGSQRTADTFQNVTARLGYGTNNLTSSSSYAYHLTSRNRDLLDRMYRSSWIIGAAIDAPADDMVKAGIKITGEIPPDVIKRIGTNLRRKGVWAGISNTVRWSRLYGGCIGVLLIDGQDLSTPLRVDTVTKGAFRGIHVIDRWLLQPTLTELITTPGPSLGMPKGYRVNAAQGGPLDNELIHHTRVVRLDGVELPFYQRQAEMGWGMSVVERIFDRLIAYDSTTTGAAQLVYKAHLRVLKVKDLRSAIAASGKAIEGITKNIEMIRALQTNEGLTVIDAEDEFDALTYSFAGLSDLLLQFGQQLSGALEVPMVRLFGQSPTGLNNNGESDLRTYYDNINQKQEANLRDPLTTILQVEYRSTVGQSCPEDLDFEFEPLWQLTEEQRATVAGQVVTATAAAMDSGIIDRPTAMRELKQSSDVTGIFTNISDEDIAAAVDVGTPPVPGEGDLEQPPGAETVAPRPSGPPDIGGVVRSITGATWPTLPEGVETVTVNADDTRVRIVR